MVSLFSLFGGKKKAKAPSTSGPSSSAASTSSTGPGRRRSRSPVPANPSNNHSSTTPRPVLGTAKSSSSSSGNKLNTLSTSAGNSGTAKFLTIRSRSSAGASALLQKGRSAQRTLTGDSTGGGSGQASAGGSPAWELPSLEFGKGDKDGRLGLDNVGGLPKITKEEWELLQGWKFGMVDINKAWKLLGEGLRISPDPTVVLSTTHTDTPSERYRAALALLILAISPSTLHKLPSLASHYPSADSHLSETWQTRFIDIFNTCTPLEQASLAKWTIQRLDNVGPIIDIAYRQFAQAERNAQYPMDAYNQYTSALAHADLQGVFQVWGDMAARAPVESMLGGKVCLLWAGWFLHAQSEKRKLVAWDELYQSWEGAGKRMQHLFYAWIRHQSVTQTLSLPTRLAQLVEGYPYGSTTDIPPIPASSFSRPVLHLQLISESPIDKIHHEALLRSAVTGMADEDAEVPIRDALLQQGDIDDLVEEDLALLTSGDVESVRSPVIDHPLLDGPTRVTSRSTHSPTPSTGTIRLGALQQEVGKMADSHSTIRGGRAPVARNVSQASRQPSVITPSVSTSTAGSTRQPVDWEDFTKSGFAEEDAALNLSLSPSASRAPQLPPIDTEGKTKPRPISKAYAPAIPTVTSTIIGECIQMVDDVFFAFVRDAQADSAATKAWAPFSLVKLRTPFVTNTDSRSTIEGILVTVQYRAPKPVTPPSIDDSTFNSAPEAPSSPGDDSSRSRFSTFGFKRQSIAGTKRMKSLFGSTRSIPRLDEQARRDEDDARQRGRLGSVTEDPRVLTPADVDEMGMMRVAQPVKADMVSFPAPVAARELQGSIESSPSAAGTNPAALMTASTALMSRQDVPSSGNTLTHASTAAPIILGKPIDSTATLTGAALPVPATSSSLRLADDTAVADWHYVAEGGAHAVFGYHGSNPTYTGKMLRLRKIVAGTDHPDDAVMAVWSKELLPTFIRPELLVETRPVHLVDGDWLRMLLDEAEQHRPEHRVQKGDLNTLAQDIDRPIKGWIMEDLRKAEHAEGERVLSVEIKPKWGFLPDAQHIHPAEAAEIKSTVGRFTLHQHYRGKAATEYNPLDLYSGNHSRMEQALDGLIHDWIESGGKANNLRVFIDGSAVQPPPSAELASSIKTAIIPTLRQSAVLDLLKRLQAGLDSTDISSIAREFSAQHPDKPIFDPASSELADVTPDELRAFVEKYHTAQPSPSEWSVRERIMAYALSAIFKDGSIMVRTVTSASTSGKTATDGLGRGTVKLLDLDLKPLKMQAWYELDEKLWKHWRDTHGNDAVSQGQGVENGAATAVPVNNAVTGEHMRTALPAVPVPSGAMVPAPAEFPISPPVSAKKAKFAGRLHLGSTSAPSAQTVPTVGMNGTMPDHSSAFPPAPSNAVPATPAVEMTLEDVLNLSPAKLRAKPGQTLPIMEESAASSREAVNGHGESLELGGIAPASKAATEDGDVLGRLEDLVIDSPVEPLSGRGRRSGAPSPSPAPEESLSSASTTASRDAGVLPEQTVSADVAERNDGIDKTVSHAPSRDTLRQLPLAPSSMHTQPESAVKYDIDGDNEIYAAPATPTFGTAEELPGSTPDPVSLSSLSLGVSPSTDSDEMGWNTPSADAHQPLASVSEEHMLPTAKNQHESSILMSPDVNHDIATGHEHDLPTAPLGDKNAIEGKLEKVVHEAVVANEGAKRDI